MFPKQVRDDPSRLKGPQQGERIRVPAIPSLCIPFLYPFPTLFPLGSHLFELEQKLYDAPFTNAQHISSPKQSLSSAHKKDTAQQAC